MRKLKNGRSSQATLDECLLLLKRQHITSLRVAGTDEIITVDEARSRIEQDGTAGLPARLTRPYDQSIVHIPGHIMQVNPQGQVSRFFYEWE